MAGEERHRIPLLSWQEVPGVGTGPMAWIRDRKMAERARGKRADDVLSSRALKVPTTLKPPTDESILQAQEKAQVVRQAGPFRDTEGVG